MPTYYKGILPPRDHIVFLGDSEMRPAAESSNTLRRHLLAGARSRLLVYSVLDECGGCDDELISIGQLFGGLGKACIPDHEFNSVDAFLAGRRQLRLALALSETVETCVEDMAFVRVSSNGESSAMHVDTCAYLLSYLCCSSQDDAQSLCSQVCTWSHDDL